MRRAGGELPGLAVAACLGDARGDAVEHAAEAKLETLVLGEVHVGGGRVLVGGLGEVAAEPGCPLRVVEAAGAAGQLPGCLPVREAEHVVVQQRDYLDPQARFEARIG
jgi:hypothetical protein